MPGVAQWLSLVLIHAAIGGDADLVRDLDGEVVQASEGGTLVVFFSMSDPEAPEGLRNLALRQAAGQEVLAVSVDSVTDGARLRPYLRGHGLAALRAAHDPMATLCERLGVGCGDAVLVRYDARTRIEWEGRPVDAPNRSDAPDLPREPTILSAFGLEDGSLPPARFWLVVDEP